MKYYYIKDLTTGKVLSPKSISWIGVWLNDYYNFDRKSRMKNRQDEDESKKEYLDSAIREAFSGQVAIYKTKEKAEDVVKSIVYVNYPDIKTDKDVFKLKVFETNL
jgi:hypothetical protein